MLSRIPLYPLNLKLENQPCAVVGGGEVAWRKTQTLLACGAQVRLIAPELHPELQLLVQEGRIQHLNQPYQKGGLQGCRLVISATDDPQVNRAVVEEARSLGALVNVVDVPDLCDFYVPAIVRRGSLQLTVSTGGRCPGLAGRLRQKLEADFAPEYAVYVDLLEEVRQSLAERLPGPPQPRMRAFLEVLNASVSISQLGTPEGEERAREVLSVALEDALSALGRGR